MSPLNDLHYYFITLLLPYVILFLLYYAMGLHIFMLSLLYSAIEVQVLIFLINNLLDYAHEILSFLRVL